MASLSCLLSAQRHPVSALYVCFSSTHAHTAYSTFNIAQFSMKLVSLTCYFCLCCQTTEQVWCTHRHTDYSDWDAVIFEPFPSCCWKEKKNYNGQNVCLILSLIQSTAYVWVTNCCSSSLPLTEQSGHRDRCASRSRGSTGDSLQRKVAKVCSRFVAWCFKWI